MRQVGCSILIIMVVMFMSGVPSLGFKDYIILGVLLAIGIAIYSSDDI